MVTSVPVPILISGTPASSEEYTSSSRFMRKTQASARSSLKSSSRRGVPVPQTTICLPQGLRLCYLADQRGQHVRFLRIEVIAWTVEIGGHGRQVTGMELPIVRPAHLDACDLGQRIGTVGGLERPGEQILFLDRLRAELGIDATGAQKEQTVDAGAVAGVDHVGLNGQVFTNKVCRIKIVGQDAADFGGGQKDVSRTLLGKEALDGDCVGQIEFGARSQQEPLKAALP